jgi:hypothetical protein
MPDDGFQRREAITGLSHQERLDWLIDGVLDVLAEAEQAGVELDPLQTIMARLQARGDELNLDEAPPIMRMLLAGLLDQ